jgi:hypothetical protein
MLYQYLIIFTSIPNTGSDEVIEEVQDEPVTQAQLDSHAKNVMYKM